MTHEQLMERHKTHSEVSDLDAGELDVYEAFLELAETTADEDILSRAWLKHHRRMVLQRG
jgi:hypothetical protein